MKKYINLAILYAILAMVGGIFYREFTKYMGFTSYTTLSVLHTHYFILGMILFLILGILEKITAFSDTKIRKLIFTYNVGLNLTVIMLLVRGICQVRQTPLSVASDSMISGLAGVGHLILGISLILVLFKIKRAVDSMS